MSRLTEASFDDLGVRDARIPGGSYLQAIWNRDVMRLSDRGRASEAIGDRWSDICSETVDAWASSRQNVRIGQTEIRIDHVARLDAVPAIALAASRRKLQNPDFLLTGDRDGTRVLLPADAKFSVETAKSKQVSAEMANALLEIGAVLTEPFPELNDANLAIDGVFLSPDYSLSHYMLQGRGGNRGRVGVDRDRFELLPIDISTFSDDLPGKDIAFQLSDLDALRIDGRRSLLAFLYYFRLARACAGCWWDLTGPLLTWRDQQRLDLDATSGHVDEHLLTHPRSAWELVVQVDREAEAVRQQRAAVDSATGLPIASAEIRARVEHIAKSIGKVPPSPNKARRLVGSWFRGELREQFGPIDPPVTDLPALLREMHAAAQALRPALLQQLDVIVAEASTDPEPTTDEAIEHENGDA